MLEIEMPQNIMNYEPKIAGIAPMRTMVCLGAAAGLGFFAYNVIGPLTNDTVRIISMLIFAGIPASFMVKPFGLKMEIFLFKIMLPWLFSTKLRIYRSENAYEEEFKKLQKEEEEILKTYYKIHKIKRTPIRKNDPNDVPRMKKNKKHPELTGYL